MKKILDAETGEVIEVDEKNDIATKRLYEVGAIDENTFDFLEMYRTVKEQYEMFTFKLKKAMKENGIKKWDNEYFSAVLTDDSLQKRLDSDRLKKDGLYDKYIKLVEVQGSLRIKFKE